MSAQLHAVNDQARPAVEVARLRKTYPGGTLDQRFGQPAAGVHLPARLAGPRHVQADPPGHRGQPAAQVADGTRVAALQPQPRFPHRVPRLADRAQHAVGDRPQMLAIALEPPRQPIPLGHLPPPHAAKCVSGKTYQDARM